MTIAEKLTQIAENQQVVYDAGFSDGLAQGSGSGEVDGYYDTFWDAYQQNGNRSNHTYAFAGLGWNNNTYNPKYTITGVIGNAFRDSKMTNTLVDIVATGNATNAFYNSSVVEITSLDISGVTSTGNMFNGCSKLERITFVGEIKLSIDLHYSSSLSNTSVQSIIDHLTDLTGTTSQTLTLNAAVIANMTTTQTAAIAAKNWNLA